MQIRFKVIEVIKMKLSEELFDISDIIDLVVTSLGADSDAGRVLTRRNERLAEIADTLDCKHKL